MGQGDPGSQHQAGVRAVTHSAIFHSARYATLARVASNNLIVRTRSYLTVRTGGYNIKVGHSVWWPFYFLRALLRPILAIAMCRWCARLSGLVRFSSLDVSQSPPRTTFSSTGATGGVISRAAFFTGARLRLAWATLRFAVLATLRVLLRPVAAFSYVLLIAFYAWP